MTTSLNPMARTASMAFSEQTGATQESAPAGGTASKVDPNELATKDAFLRLLVAQIKNQNPLNPADGIQFLSQLAQFSELEQMIGIRQELEALHGDINQSNQQAGDTVDSNVSAAA